MAQGGMDLMDWAMRGGELAPKAAAKLEQAVRRNPADAASRAQLAGYYFMRTRGLKSAERCRHSLWFIENLPAEEFTGSPFVAIHKAIQPREHLQARKAWLKHVRSSSDPATLANAAQFFDIDEPRRSEAILKRAVRGARRNPDLHGELGDHYWRRASVSNGRTRTRLARLALSSFEEQLRLTTEQPDRWYHLKNVALATLEAGRVQQAVRNARAMLRIAKDYPKDWNYGNALHHAHSVLGRAALRAGDIDSAAAHLLQSGETPGSPQLNSFGPTFELAKELLSKGKKDAVLKYLDQCARFWARSNGELERWAEEIRRTGTSNFVRQFGKPARRRQNSPKRG